MLLLRIDAIVSGMKKKAPQQQAQAAPSEEEAHAPHDE